MCTNMDRDQCPMRCLRYRSLLSEPWGDLLVELCECLSRSDVSADLQEQMWKCAVAPNTSVLAATKQLETQQTWQGYTQLLVRTVSCVGCTCVWVCMCEWVCVSMRMCVTLRYHLVNRFSSFHEIRRDKLNRYSNTNLNNLWLQFITNVLPYLLWDAVNNIHYKVIFSQ